MNWFRKRQASPQERAEHALPLQRTARDRGFAVLDVETTGLWPSRCRIVEVAVVLLDERCQPVAEFVSLVNPRQDVGPTHIHGLSARDVAGAPTFAQLAPTLLSFIAGRVPVAHNASFDMRFLAEELQRLNCEFDDAPVSAMCTMQMAPSYLPSLPARSLADCAHAAGIGPWQAHSALDDARVTARLLAHYRAQHQLLPPSWQDTLSAAAVYQWPQLPPIADCVPVTRAAAVRARQVEVPYLARLVATLPRTGGQNPDVQSYLAVLDRALEDRLVTEQEAAELAGLAADLSLSSDQILTAHREYLAALAAAALADGVVTPAERADLETATHLLALATTDLQAALRAAAEQRASSGADPDRHHGWLHIGDRVVITGDTLLMDRQQMEAATIAAGLRLVSAVSGKTTVLVATDPYSQSNKAKRARDLGVRILGEAAYLTLLKSVQPAPAASEDAPAGAPVAGRPVAPAQRQPPTSGASAATAGALTAAPSADSTAGRSGAGRPSPRTRSAMSGAADGPLAGRKFLLVGFTGDQREDVIVAVTAAGGAIGAYVKASLAGVLVAPGCEHDELAVRCALLGVPTVELSALLTSLAPSA